MILASAIKYYVPKTGKEVVLCGVRHGDIFDQEEALGFDPKELKEIEQGFITHDNKFLNRAQAFEHAKACGQLCATRIYERENGGVGGKNLISEDLW